MNQINLKYFPDTQSLDNAVVEILTTHFQLQSSHPQAIMLSGGSTPLPAYNAIRESRCTAVSGKFIVYSDDRMVPADSPDSNYHNTSSMIASLGIASENVIRVHTECDLDDAAERYERDITQFFEDDGEVTLGLLGLGGDGHTASIFTLDDARYTSRFTLVARNRAGFDRVSVSAKLLRKVTRLIFMVSGSPKASVLAQLFSDPSALPAGQAILGHANVEVWTDIPAH